MRLRKSSNESARLPHTRPSGGAAAIYVLPCIEGQAPRSCARLDLTNTPITDEGLNELAGLKPRVAAPRMTMVTEEAIRKLQKALPESKIRWLLPQIDAEEVRLVAHVQSSVRQRRQGPGFFALHHAQLPLGRRFLGIRLVEVQDAVVFQADEVSLDGN